MAIIYSQTISKCEALKVSGSYSDVITDIHYTLTGTSGSVSSSIESNYFLDVSNITDFVPYENTPEFEETVWSWISGSDCVLDQKIEIEESIDNQIQKNNLYTTLTFS
tara:strand:- start:8 stop:331 length:324 start_codon:yes stop_codon:yes gene_type:complete